MGARARDLRLALERQEGWTAVVDNCKSLNEGWADFVHHR